jgi:hypothetical protein
MIEMRKRQQYPPITFCLLPVCIFVLVNDVLDCFNIGKIKKIRSCFSEAEESEKVNCVPESASVFAEATPRQVSATY